MNNKIIGFTICKEAVDHSDVDIFNSGLILKEMKKNGFFIYIWGIGDLEACFLDKDSFSLSFPFHSSLENRNVIVAVHDNFIKIENDWLGSIPVFYNSGSLKISTLMNKVLDDHIIMDSEGVNNYLDFGYSVFELTPVKGIKFLRYFSSLIVRSGKIEVEYKRDLVIEKLSGVSDPVRVLEHLKDHIRYFEEKSADKIILPTSGGFDSRLLNILINDKKRITAFTYGVSTEQHKSSEVVKAKKISEVLGTRWEQIKLDNFNKYYNEWFKLFGCSTHLHGMYHIEFYKKIKYKLKNDPAVLISGIFGDIWAGKVSFEKINSYKDLIKLSYAHGMNSSSSASTLHSNYKQSKDFFITNGRLLKNPKFSTITTIRLKIILISYLLSLPDYFGWPSWTPFLRMDSALDMLNLPPEQRKGRKWQSSFFAKHNLDIESLPLEFDDENCLNIKILKKEHVSGVKKSNLTSFIGNNYLDKVIKKYNKLLESELYKEPFTNKFFNVRFISRLAKLFFKPKILLKPYYETLVLKALDLTIDTYDRR